MIIKSTYRQAGGLEAHLLRSDTNEAVHVRTDFFRGADDLHGALRLMEAIARTNPRVRRTFVHIVISPGHELTDAELVHVLERIEQEHGIAADAPRAVVEHEKGERPTHFHVVYSIVDLSTGKALRSHDNHSRDELIGRVLELEFGERIVPGKHLAANVAELRRRGLEADADRLSAFEPLRDKDGLSRADRQQASRLGLKEQDWSAKVGLLFERAGRDLAAFAGLLQNAGLSVARVDKALLPDDARSDKTVLLVDHATGFSTSLVRLLRREAKAAGRPIDIKEQDVSLAFPAAPPFAQVRIAGLEHARTGVEQALGTERRRAVFEAAVDGDADELAAFRRGRKAREDAAAATQNELTLKERREEIVALYRERDNVRRRRVDRAFRLAGLLDTPTLRRLAFTLAMSGILMTGGGLAVALAGAVVASRALPTRARAQAMAQTARRERTEDTVRRRADLGKVPRKAQSGSRARFTFDQVTKEDRVLAGAYVDALLRGDASTEVARGAATALGPEVVAGLERMLERGSHLQVRRLRHWYRGIAPDRRSPSVDAALKRHAAPSRPASNRARTRPNTRARNRTGATTASDGDPATSPMLNAIACRPAPSRGAGRRS